MKILFVGTGSGKTSLDRFHSSLLLKSDDVSLLVDAGDSVSRALLTAGIDYESISGILFTHMHPDHAMGLPSLIVQMKMAEREKELLIYCHKNHYESIVSILKYTLILPERLKFDLKFIIFSEEESVRVSDEISFTSRMNSHLDDLKKELPESERTSCSFIFNINNKNVFYTGDILSESDLYLFGKSKPEIYISESTHLNVNQIIKAFHHSGADRLYLTHIRDEEKPEVNLPGIFIVKDRFEIEL